MKKRNKGFIVASVLMAAVMLSSLTAYGAVAWDKISTKLPANQKTTEVSTVARSHSSSSYKYFTIEITSIGSGYTAVCAWAEKPNGKNYSNSSTQVGIETTNVSYTTVPSAGANVVLNLRNPVKTATTPAIKGKWTPN